ncbi:predicted protein [Plenodomus lingam JN3]|uniref:Predicted protein n=1 Tax=Leptosphaeria maculans (strain JN3 / isolate v23.1.3 / race Av1-4-5-6-7-8) TaxID=985895 RepID=E4ZT87_LEPMJ|nr:predicted protein [Plenodomus lingam JN3]CBX90029.1 predicted protein [Plenodomus lingam JN3]
MAMDNNYTRNSRTKLESEDLTFKYMRELSEDCLTKNDNLRKELTTAWDMVDEWAAKAKALTEERNRWMANVPQPTKSGGDEEVALTSRTSFHSDPMRSYNKKNTKSDAAVSMVSSTQAEADSVGTKSLGSAEPSEQADTLVTNTDEHAKSSMDEADMFAALRSIRANVLRAPFACRHQNRLGIE